MSERSIEVVAGVITDARGRILLSRRTPTQDLPGLWEFPGGKREPGEAADHALARELDEELGIRAVIGAPLIAVPQAYPHKRIRLDVRHVARWTGTPRGREGQALAWVAPERLGRYSMPPADLPVVAALRQPSAYLVTPEPGDDDAEWLAGLDRAIARDVRRVQIRLHGMPPSRQARLLGEAATLCVRRQVDVLFNGAPALARAAGVGVHLSSSALRGMRERPVPPSVRLAASCHSLEELRMAEALGCDFVVLGHVHATPSHPGVPGIGWPAFEALREHTALPIYAIGGLAPADLDEARRHGAQGIAAIRGLWGAADA
ncbi:Nudix family hydrolase [Luteimonas deserti]|uniref:8-oxo-dGTP diphosphatase n=1 Tax=Luteimonas deserti TaxID=2752306 RepID=A0A7Z0QS86_9GAMM|nr:Nudix family hydrolase [Luteimonas deserti]NYZ62835.1 Nudix family hydrolase [Luteimonas deserti]